MLQIISAQRLHVSTSGKQVPSSFQRWASTTLPSSAPFTTANRWHNSQTSPRTPCFSSCSELSSLNGTWKHFYLFNSLHSSRCFIFRQAHTVLAAKRNHTALKSNRSHCLHAFNGSIGNNNYALFASSLHPIAPLEVNPRDATLDEMNSFIWPILWWVLNRALRQGLTAPLSSHTNSPPKRKDKHSENGNCKFANAMPLFG